MVINRTAVSVVCGLMGAHLIILYLSGGSYNSVVDGILWLGGKNPEYLNYPFPMSRFWDILMWPAIVFCTNAISDEKLRIDKLCDSDTFGWMQIAPVIAGAIFTAVFLVCRHSHNSGTEGANYYEFFEYFRNLGVVSLITFSVFWWAGIKVSTYASCTLLVSAGVVAGAFVGLPIFIILFVPASLVALLVVGYFPSVRLQALLSGQKKKLQKKTAFRNEMKKEINKALALKVSPETHRKIASACEEVPELLKDVLKWNTLAEETKEKIDVINAHFAKLSEISDGAKVDSEVMNSIIAGNAEIDRSFCCQRDAFAGTRKTFLDNASVGEKRLAEIREIFAAAEKEDAFCKKFDQVSENSKRVEKDISIFVNKIANELPKE